MCDYSLMSLPNRLATEGETLVVHRFATGSVGFTSVMDLNKQAEARQSRSFWTRLKDFLGSSESCPVPAVCIPPAARLLLHNCDNDLRKKYDLRSEEEVKFVQLSADPNTYRDAVCFGNGTVLRLQQLPIGQRAMVLHLGNDGVEERTLEFVEEL